MNNKSTTRVEKMRARARTHTHAHTHTRLTALFPGLHGWAGTRKVKPIWMLLKQETVSGSGISWAICKSAPRSRQHLTTQFLQVGCASCRPTNSVKAPKAKKCIRCGQFILRKNSKFDATMQMSDSEAKMHQIRFPLELCPRPHCTAYSAP